METAVMSGENQELAKAFTGKINQFSKQKKIWFLHGFCLDFQKNPFLEKVPFFQSGFSCNSMLGFTLFQRWKKFCLKCRKTWKLHFPMFDLLGSTNGMLCTKVGKCSNNNVENIPGIW